MKQLRQKLIHAALILLILGTSVIGVGGQSNGTQTEAACVLKDEVEEAPEWIKNGGIILLVVVVIIMFWGLALVCEEYFVPALNVMCEEWKIPDDVAGATLMAAGASSPELFTAAIGLLVYNSNIGVGTVVGSEIFNHMIISAGSVLFAQKGTLHLDAKIVLRDLFFYMLSLFILIYSLKGYVFESIGHVFDFETWDDCLSVTTMHAWALVIIYVVYAIVCAYYQRLIALFCPAAAKPDDATLTDAASVAASATVNPVFAPENLHESVRIGQFNNNNLPPESEAYRDTRLASSHSPLVDSRVPSSMFVAGRFSGWVTDADRVMSSAVQHATLRDINPRMAIRPSQLLTAIKKKRQADIKSSLKERAASTNGSRQISMVDMEKRLDSLAESAQAAPSRLSAYFAGVNVDDDEMAEARKEYIKDYSEIGEISTKVCIYDVPDHKRPSMCKYLGLVLLDALPPAGVATVEKGEGIYKCYLEVFQDCIKLDALPEWRTWQRRYFVISEHGLYSYSNPHEPITGPHVQIIDLSTATDVIIYDDREYVFGIKFANNVMTDLSFRAANDDVMRDAMRQIKLEIRKLTLKDDQEKLLHLDAMKDVLWRELEEGEKGFHVHDSLAAPEGRYAFMWHCLVYPLKLAFTYSLVDCREKGMRPHYGSTILVCIVYLGLMSFLMILCCDNIGVYLGTTPTVIGLTLSAVGTSFPNLWSSMVVARQGYGNMAICNALGSNIFNLDMALGLPWAALLILREGKPYNDMKDNGIVFFILLLGT
jgi:Ca2+/Na+ antiporter